MRRMFRSAWTIPLLLAVVLATGVFLTTPLTAQTTLSNTTWASAVSQTTTTVSVTSAATMAVGDLIYSDHEAMVITAISGTTITVQRGMEGTSPAPHRNASIIFSGVPDRFYVNDPPFGDCSPRASIRFLPWINVRTGTLWTCDGANWRATNTLFLTFNSTIVG